MSRIESGAVDILGWNIKAGGFDAYSPDLVSPSREEGIRAVISDFRNAHRASAVSLSDAYRWDTTYGGNAGIADHLGYSEARFVPLDDERLKNRGEDGIGVVFATNQRIESSQPIDLDTRQGLLTVMDIGKYGLQVASVYLDDLSEDTRLRQIRALVAGIEKDMPTVLVGDFNALRPKMSGASVSIKARDMAVRALAFGVPKRSELGVAIREMNRREAAPLLESLGFRDADAARKRPTAPAVLPIFGIDYALHNDLVAVDNPRIVSAQKQSDHDGFAFTATVS